MQVIIAGGRDIHDYNILLNCIAKSKFKITSVSCGCCRGVDDLGRSWAHQNQIPVKYFPAEWTKWGRKAGPIRNKDMAVASEALILLWDGKSNGSLNMFYAAKNYGLKVYERIIDGSESIADKNAKAGN